MGRLTSAALGRWTGWRGRRAPAWWGFEEVGRHDWTQILEAGRETLRFDSRAWVGDVDVPTAVVVNDDDGVVPTARQHDLAERIPDAATFTVAGGHAVCTTAPGPLPAGAARRLPPRVAARWLLLAPMASGLVAA